MRDGTISMGHAAVNLYAAAMHLKGARSIEEAAREFRKQYELEREFFAVGPNVWGRGQSAALAKEALRKSNGGRLPKQWVIKSCPAGTEISLDTGGLMWPGFLDSMDVRAPFVVEHRGLGKKALTEIACTCETQRLFKCPVHDAHVASDRW